MKIIGKVKPDEDGRICLPNVGLEEFKVGFRIYFDLEKEMISIREAKDFKFGPIYRVDQESRITIPKWLISEISNREIFVLIDERDDSIWLSVKTGNIF